MDVTATPLPGILLIRPRVFRDDRGRFLETWRRERYVDAGLPADFVQDNAAVSTRGVLRGLHYQYPEPQGKLVMALQGEVWDVAVDVRRGSPHFGRWYATTLSAENGHQLWIPEGFAHGYVALSESAVFAYKCTRAYHPAGDAAIRWDDPELGIDWPVAAPVLSDKDAAAPLLRDIDPA
ncbi:MAG: dTDP-4-dehydrorhamnose 3,5-epimerase, partial [Gemmatimonadota bacterium]